MLYVLVLIYSVAALFCWVDPSWAAGKKRILVLHPYNETLPASMLAGRAIRERLLDQYGSDLEIYSEYLDLLRFPDEQHQQTMGKHIAEKYGSKTLSLTIALGAPSLQFVLSQRQTIGAGIPVVFCCVTESVVAELEKSDNVFGVVSNYNARSTLELAKRLQPNARRVLVISGASQMDRVFEAEARRSFREYEGRLNIQYLSGMPIDELLDMVSSVPRSTIILVLNYLADIVGQKYIPQSIVARIAHTASAPTYGIFDTWLGAGIVGGSMDTFHGASKAAAELAIRVLAGAVTSDQRISARSDRHYIVDARQLDRWNLARDDLPQGTVVEFETPPVWVTHRKEVTAAMIAFGMAMLALVILLTQVRRRIKAEAYLRESEERLNFAAASGGTGLWLYDIGKTELWCSEHCRAIFGLKPDCPPTTENMLRRVHPEDRGIAAASIRAAIYGPHTETLLEFRVVRPGGQTRSIQAKGHTTLDGEGNPIRVSGEFRDLTAYRAAQKEAQDLSKRVLSIQDEERKRIAQELHDSTAQHLAAINLNLMALVVAGKSAEQRSHLIAEIRRSLVAAMNELRIFTYLLYPQELAQRGLHGAIVSFIQGYSQRTGLAVRLRESGQLDDLPHVMQQSLLRIVQESLANVHRHASASRVTVKLQRTGSRIHLLIADNGSGLRKKLSVDRADEATMPLGVGIPGMAARARQLGGELDVRSRSSGTLVRASLPIGHHASGAALTAASGTRQSGGPDFPGSGALSIVARRGESAAPHSTSRSTSERYQQHSL